MISFRSIILLSALTGTVAAHAQSADPEISTLDSIQKTLQAPAREVLYADNDELKAAANRDLVSGLKEALLYPGAFDFGFDSLVTLSRLISDDGKVKLITWNMPLDNGSFKYFGFVLYREKKNKAAELFELGQNDPEQNAEYKQLDAANWYGALYYKMIYFKRKGKRYYTLLGWKGNNTLTTKKVIDVLTFPKKDVPVFGAPIFIGNGQAPKQRVVFEFSADVSMSIMYDESHQTIIMDHLFPSGPGLEGHFEFYGPDLSFDAYTLEKGEWIYEDDYDPGLRPDKKEIKLKNEKKMY